jgi:hypothetical protein
MWYVSKIATWFSGEIYAYQNYDDVDVIKSIEFTNTATKEVLVLENYSPYQADGVVDISPKGGNSLLFFLKQHNIEEKDVFGVNFKSGLIFSTTDFGMILYDCIDYLNEFNLTDKDDEQLKYRGSFSLVDSFVVYRDTDEDDDFDSYTTLDRLVLYKHHVMMGDYFAILNDEDNVKELYSIIDKVKFTKLEIMKG